MGQFILRKIIESVATMSDFKAKRHQIRFRLGSAPDPAIGELTAPPDLQLTHPTLGQYVSLNPPMLTTGFSGLIFQIIAFIL